MVCEQQKAGLNHAIERVSALALDNSRDPERDKRTDTSLTRWVIPIRPNALSDRDDLIPVFSVIDTKLTEAKVHRPAGGLGCGSQFGIDTFEDFAMSCR